MYISSTTSDTQGYSERRKYIATQGELVIISVVCIEVLQTQTFAGPLPNTVTDFWWLVWQEKIHVVAMVTSVVEEGQQKCEQYWPSQETQEYGPFKVTLTDQQVFADYTIRQLLVAVSVVAVLTFISVFILRQFDCTITLVLSAAAHLSGKLHTSHACLVFCSHSVTRVGGLH